MKILYIDLGLHKGKELWQFCKTARLDGWDYQAHGVEANQDKYMENRMRYIEYDNIHVHHYAICSQNATLKLYKDKSEGQGDSIYASKNNVTTAYQTVDGIKFSKFMEDIQFRDINILRFNIEGAEWDLMNDLIETGLYKKFQLFLGEPFGEDIQKVGLDQAVYLNKLMKHGIEVFPYCLERPGFINLESKIKELLND